MNNEKFNFLVSGYKQILLKTQLKNLPLIFTTLFIISCNNYEELYVGDLLEETAIMLESRDDCTEEFEGVVNTASLGIIELAKNSSLRDFVHKKIAEQFDGDYNVLLKTLEQSFVDFSKDFSQSIELHRANISLSSRLINYKEFQIFTTPEKISKVVTGYPTCNTILYSQIYVPFFEEVHLASTPVIVIGYDEPDNCIVPGYQIQSDGSIKVINVDEDFARKNLVWVVSINERVDESGVVNYQELDESNYNLENEIESRMNNKVVKVDSIFISDKKECWICGKGDISFIAIQAINCSLQGGVLFGRDFIKIGNSDVNKWHIINDANGLSYMALNPENPLTHGECLGFILYERDAQNSSNEKNWTYWSCATGGDVTVYYYTKGSPYGSTETNRYCYNDFTNNTTWTPLGVPFNFAGANVRLKAARLN